MVQNESGELVLTAEQHNAHSTDVNAASWSPQGGGSLVSVGDDMLVKVWELSV